MSGHHKGKGFSQTSKQYDGALKAQHQQSRSKQVDHSAEVHEEETPTPSDKNVKSSSSGFKKGK